MKVNNSILSSIIAVMLLFTGCNSPMGNFDFKLTLKVSVEDILRNLSNYSPDKTFATAITRAKELQKQDQSDFITLFVKAFQEVDPNAKLAAIFCTTELRDKINFNSTNDEVLAAIRDEINVATNRSFEVIKKRISYYGIPKNIIKIKIIDNNINIEIYGIDNPERIKKLFTVSSKLEFWETYENSEVIGFLNQANELLKGMKVYEVKPLVEQPAPEGAAPDTTTSKEDQILLDLLGKDTAKTAAAFTREQFNLQNPLFGVLSPRVTNDGQPLPSSMVGLSSGTDTARVNEYLKMDQIKTLFPRDLRFYWSQNPYKYDETETLYELHAIKVTTRNSRPPLGGDVITGARPSTGRTGQVKVDFSMNAEGAKKWQLMTRENINRCIAVILDGYVRSYPRVQNEITGGSTEITGDFTMEEAEDLANILKSGALPFELQIVEEQIIKRK